MTRFKADFFTGNRHRLSVQVPKSLIIVAAQSTVQKSSDLAYPFQQDNNFWYLTGITEPDFLLAIDTDKQETILLLPQKNQYQNEWDGAFDMRELEEASGIGKFEPRDQLQSLLKSAKKRRLEVCTLKALSTVVEPYGFYANPARQKLINELNSLGIEYRDIRLEIARLRQVKQEPELAAIQQAIDITALTLGEVKSNLNSYKTEKDIERAISAGFYTHGADGHAYDPIVGAGKNASTIHYMKNSAPLRRGEMILLDVGAQVDGYAADISRSWGFGVVSKRQQEVFKVVEALQNEALHKLKAGVYLREYQQEMEKLAFKFAKKIGVELEQYPHGFSHFLGLDVHDAGDYESPLAEGAVLTVEPGLYLQNEAIGVRIEDDVLITKNGIRNLSSHIPKTL